MSAIAISMISPVLLPYHFIFRGKVSCMPMSPEIHAAKDDLQRITMRAGLIVKHLWDMEVSIDKALESEENRRKIKQAADNLEDYCKDVARIYKQIGK
jgi:hypothetical protein